MAGVSLINNGFDSLSSVIPMPHSYEFQHNRRDIPEALQTILMFCLSVRDHCINVQTVTGDYSHGTHLQNGHSRRELEDGVRMFSHIGNLVFSI